MLLREKAVAKNKAAKRKQADVPEVPDAAPTAEWDVAKSLSAAAAAPKATGKKTKAAKSESAASQAKRLDKERQKTDRDNEKKMADAVKALAQLTPQAKALVAMKGQAAKWSLALEKDLDQALKDTDEKKTAAHALVAAGNHMTAHVPLPALPFKPADLKVHVVATKELVAQARKEVQVAKDKAAQAEEEAAG